jgi:apolipoprotein N-acyltransferase
MSKGISNEILKDKARFCCPHLLYFLIAFIAGGILPLAFAPIHLWSLALLSQAILLWLLQLPTTTPKNAFLLGGTYGIGMFGIGISWVIVSIYRFGNTELPLAVLITGCLVVLLASFPAIQAYLLKKFFKGNTVTFWLLGFPSSWVLFEWLRSWVLTGFPWLYLGYSQLDTPLGGFAPVLSVYGVSFAVSLTGAAVVALFLGKRKIKMLAAILLLLSWGGGQLLQMTHFTHPQLEPITVSLVQGNIKPFDKFSQMDPIGTNEKIYGSLSQAHWKNNIILWPESAIPLPLPDSQAYIDKLQAKAIANNATLITGIQVVNANNEYYNSLIAVGKGKGIYHKQHLVPFGDFLPFEHWLRGLINFFDLPMSSFISGPVNQDLIVANHIKFDPLICYEIAFPELVRTTLRDADAIITLSEDGWFGESWGPHQHLQIARMRALETGRFVLRATTSGITAIIDAKGKLVATAPQFTATVLNGSFYSMTGTTPWVTIGLWPLLIILSGLFILPGRLRFSKN